MKEEKEDGKTVERKERKEDGIKRREGEREIKKEERKAAMK